MFECLQENVTIRNLKIVNTLRPRDPPRMVRQFQFNAWAKSSFTPVSKTMALDLLDLVLDYQDTSDHPDSPIGLCVCVCVCVCVLSLIHI